MSDDEADFIWFGKQLKELVEGESIRKRPISVEEQIATDQNGKRRFHGAFTGGFSAGFFNTVDTPQGWAPSQFKSSRDTRQERQSQRPEDFMDSEDFGDFGFAPHAVRPKAKFQSKKSEEREQLKERELFAPVLNKLIQPGPPTIGESLLRQQGWKPGQGIGPKAIKKLKEDRKSSYSRTYGSGSALEAADDYDPTLSKYKDFLFAPDDLPVQVATPKENLFGMGYRGLERPDHQPSTSTFNVKTGLNKKKFSISGQAFGVGAYEEEDDDVYNRNDLGQYDFVLDGGSPPRSSSKASQRSSSEISGLADTLDGFRLGTSCSLLKKKFPAPVLPRNWKPSTVGRIRTSRFEEEDDIKRKPAPTSGKSTNPTRDERRSVLFPESIEKVKIEPTTVKEEPNQEVPGFLSDPGSKGIDHSSFKPFQASPAKQTRYEQYLVCLQNNRKDALKFLQPKDMTEWERERERVEFERAAHLYRPMKTTMASRFVSAGSSNDSDEGSGSGASEKSKAASLKMFGKLTRETTEWIPARTLCVRFNIKNPHGDHKQPDNDGKKKNKFAGTQLFSLLGSDAQNPTTNSSENVETRNRVRNGCNNTAALDHVKEEEEGLEKVLLVKEESEDLSALRPPMDLFKAIFAISDSDTEDDDATDTDLGRNETEKVEVVSDPCQEGASASPSPVMDIDAEDEEDSDSSDVYGPRLLSKPAHTVKTATKSRATPSRPEKRADKATRSASGLSRSVVEVRHGEASGIFAGIDFDKFVKRRKKTPPPLVRERVAATRPKSILDRSIRQVLGIKSGDTSDGDYGPSLPPTNKNVEKIVISSDTDNWEEKPTEKKKKQKKEKMKKKKKKHKHKKDNY